MTVSALIPTYNRRAYICRAVDSILAQTTPVDEIVIVDDGSTDGTADFVEARYGSKVRVIRQKNTGVAGARHRGIREARGEWIAFLDSDDEWTPDRTEQLKSAAAAVPSDVAWVFGNLRVVTDRGEGLTLFEEHGLSIADCPYVFPDSLVVQYPFQFGMLQGSWIRRSALLSVNCFSEGLRSDDDLLAGFQVACRYRVAAIPAIVGRYYRTTDLSASSVMTNGVYGPDYFRSRMMAFAAVIATGRKNPWHLLYASEVRGLCKVLALRGPVSRELAFDQFRFGGVSAKGLGFLCAAMFGRLGILAWVAIAERRRGLLRTDSPVVSPAAN